MEDNKKINNKLYEAYIYAIPLIVLDLHTKALTNTQIPTSTKAPINQFSHAKGVATAKDREVVHPNIDTVYSKAHMNLKDGPLYFHKPAASRYAASEIIDAYGNCVVNIGSGELGGNGEIGVVLVGPDYHGDLPAELVRIDVPTNSCWTLTRILKNGNDESEIESIQKGFDIRPIHAYKDDNYIPPKGIYREEYDFIPYDKLSEISIEEFFTIFNQMIGDNLGKDPDMELLEDVKKYGVGDGLKFQLSSFDPEIQEALNGFSMRVRQEFNNLRANLSNHEKKNWEFEKPENSTTANYKWNYLRRAEVAWDGFGALPATVAIYPQAFLDDDGEVLCGKNRYVCHFESEPPVGEFWSLTVYGEDQFLIPNELDRNGINDRSELQKNADGSFDIYLQKDRPSEDKISNWLPTGDGLFGLVLRLYYAKDEFINGKWKVPSIEKISE